MLDAALRVIVRDGQQAANMTSVARELNLTKPVVYAVFPNFKALADALIEREQLRCLAQIRDAFTATVRPGLQPSQLLAVALGAFLRSVAERPDPWRLVLMPSGPGPSGLRRRVREGRRWAVEGLTRLCEQMIPPTRADGSRIDLEAFVESLIATAERYAQLMLARPDEWTPERLERFAEHDLVLPGAGPVGAPTVPDAVVQSTELFWPEHAQPATVETTQA